MRNKDLWESYDTYTSDLTKHARQLAFAGAAICWFFRSPEVTFPALVLIALSCFVIFFLGDILQYYTAAMVLRVWTRRQEKIHWARDNTIEGEYEKPEWLDWPALFFFHIKIGMLLLGFTTLSAEFIRRM